VRVPRTNLVGREQELAVAMTTLMCGASLPCPSIASSRARDPGRAPRAAWPTAIEDGWVRERLARLATEAGAAPAQSPVSRRIRGDAPGPEASVAKLFGTELNLRVVEFASELIGQEGLLDRRRGVGDETTKWLRRILAVRAFTIGGGTSEVQRNIIGERVLKLPRS
jgi:alkylation response protein AidB-like acyl-CoA dehydrogenase